MNRIKHEKIIKFLQYTAETFFLILILFFNHQLKAEAKENKPTNYNETDIKNPFYKAEDSRALRQVPRQIISNEEKKLNLTRNPFSSMQGKSNEGNLILSGNISFTGIAKVGDSNIVFADTSNGRSFLKVGSDLGNGYSISKIDIDKSLIKISNGILTYKVTFKKK